MFGKPITLFRLLGFTVRMDWSWLILASLITWTLADIVFRDIGDLSDVQRWLMGLAGTAGMFVSVVFHELCHSLVARKYGLEMKGITLFVFGGMAEMTEEPSGPKVEFLMAIAGPLSSIALAIILFALWLGLEVLLVTPVVTLVVRFLWIINVVLAVFNMIPAYPMDGGRVLRSALWAIKKDLRWATRISSKVGSGFGLFLLVLGVMQIVLAGDLIGGIWWLFIGWFVRSAARNSYQQLVMRQALMGEPLAKFMNPNPITVEPAVSVQQLVDNYVYRYGFTMFPVVDAGDLLGCINIEQIKQVPREQWSGAYVREMMTPCSQTNTVPPNVDAVRLLAQMQSTGQNRVMVASDHHLIGVVTLKDLLKFLTLKVQIEEGSDDSPPIKLAG